MIDFKIREGYVLCIAPHEGVKGFCAAVISCFGCFGDLAWDEVGHGHTIEQAVEQAGMKVNGQLPKPEYKMENFE